MTSMSLEKNDVFTLAVLALGILLSLRAPHDNMNVIRTDQYTREVRKATKKDKQMKRRVEQAESEIIADPEHGEMKSINRGSRGSVLAGLIRSYGNPIYGKNVGKNRILYHYDKDTGDLTFLRFGSHKHLYQGPGHTM